MLQETCDAQMLCRPAQVVFLALSYVGVSIDKEPQNRTLYAVILVISTPQKAAPNSWKPHILYTKAAPIRP